MWAWVCVCVCGGGLKRREGKKFSLGRSSLHIVRRLWIFSFLKLPFHAFFLQTLPDEKMSKSLEAGGNVLCKEVVGLNTKESQAEKREDKKIWSNARNR